MTVPLRTSEIECPLATSVKGGFQVSSIDLTTLGENPHDQGYKRGFRTGFEAGWAAALAADPPADIGEQDLAEAEYLVHFGLLEAGYPEEDAEAEAHEADAKPAIDWKAIDPERYDGGHKTGWQAGWDAGHRYAEEGIQAWMDQDSWEAGRLEAQDRRSPEQRMKALFDDTDEFLDQLTDGDGRARETPRAEVEEDGEDERKSQD